MRGTIRPGTSVSGKHSASSFQKPLPGGNNLRADIIRRRSTITVATAHRVIHAEHIEHRIADTFVDRCQFSQREIFETTAFFLGKRDDPSGYVMRFAERDSGLTYQPVGKVGRGRKPLTGRSGKALTIEGQVGDHAGRGGDTHH